MSNRNIPISIFNPGSVPLQIVVNNGSPISIAGTGPSQNWVPQPNSGLSFTGGYPGPGAFGYGGNNVQVNAGGTPIYMQVSIPQAQIMSLQLYIFFANSSVSWTLLNNGQVMGSGSAES